MGNRNVSGRPQQPDLRAVVQTVRRGRNDERGKTRRRTVVLELDPTEGRSKTEILSLLNGMWRR